MFDTAKVILVEPSHPGNIGAVARAMKNMGFTRLVLVQPRRYPDEEATWRAASASDVLESAVVVDTVEEAIAECHYVVGTSARERRIPWPILDSRRAATEIFQQSSAGTVGLLFGREDRGLTNEELQLCNLHVNIPTDDSYRSMNLAMAVQVMCYELRMLSLEGHLPNSAEADWDSPFVDKAKMALFFEHLETTLLHVGFLDPKSPRQLMTRLKRLYNRVQIDEMELNILRGILTETQKVIRERDLLQADRQKSELDQP